MSKRSLEETRSGSRPPETVDDGSGSLPVQDLLSDEQPEQQHFSGPSKRPRTFIASVVSKTLLHFGCDILTADRPVRRVA